MSERNMNLMKAVWRGLGLGLALALMLAPGSAVAQESSVKLFATPQEATAALEAAAAKSDMKALASIFGQESGALLGSAEDLAAPAELAAFSRAYKQHHELTTIDAYQVLLVGDDNWPFPVPLAKTEQGKWYFDVEAGHDELTMRRLGRNELDAIEVCRVYFEAQQEYYQMNPQKSSAKHYARHIVSQPGQMDGLYWEAAEDRPVSPLGELMAGAEVSAAKQGEQRPYYGYYYKILTGQGANASGGAWSYLDGDQMLGGFGLLAYPAEYGASGVMSFIVNQAGAVYEKDLGPETAQAAAKLELFDPDSSWTVVSEEPAEAGPDEAAPEAK